MVVKLYNHVCSKIFANSELYLGKFETFVFFYYSSFYINKTDTIYCYSHSGEKVSKVESAYFLKFNQQRTIKLKTPYSNQYDAGGDNALIDGIIGTEDFRTGTWQGYWNEDLDAIVDLGKNNNKQGRIEIHFLEDQRSWIFLPSEVEILVSSDAKNYQSLGNYAVDNTKENENTKIQKYIFKYPSNLKVRYLKIIAKKLGRLPFSIN